MWYSRFQKSTRYALRVTRYGKGQGLLEAVVALGIIIAGIVAALTLGIANLSAGTTNESRIIAANLAREAVELARNVRDSNWVKGGEAPWDAGLEEEGDAHPYAPRWNAEKWQMEFATASGDGRLYFLPDEGIYTPDTGGQSTRFFRRVFLTSICASGLDVCGRAERIGIRVKADVAWERRGVRPIKPQMEVVAELYQWRQ